MSRVRLSSVPTTQNTCSISPITVLNFRGTITWKGDAISSTISTPLGLYIATYRDFAADRSSNIFQINDSLTFEYFGMMREQTAILIIYKSAVSSPLFHLRKILLWQKPQISSITSDDSERCSSNYHGSVSVSISWYTIMSAKRLA